MTLWERINPLLHLKRLAIGVVATIVLGSLLLSVWLTDGVIVLVFLSFWVVGLLLGDLKGGSET
jgi:hypothetical protein